MDVDVYFNLHCRLFSVRSRLTGRVIGHARKVLVRDVAFVVQPAGRAKALATGCKNVHAFVRGALEGALWQDCDGPMPWHRGDAAYGRAACRLGRSVTYRPSSAGHFYDLDHGGRIDAAEMVFAFVQGRSPGVIAFDPCDMTAAESEAATV